MTCKNCGHPHNEHNLLLTDPEGLACGGFWYNETLQTLTQPCECEDCRCDHCEFREQYKIFKKERGIE